MLWGRFFPSLISIRLSSSPFTLLGPMFSKPPTFNPILPPTLSLKFAHACHKKSIFWNKSWTLSHNSLEPLQTVSLNYPKHYPSPFSRNHGLNANIALLGTTLIDTSHSNANSFFPWIILVGKNRSTWPSWPQRKKKITIFHTWIEHISNLSFPRSTSSSSTGFRHLVAPWSVYTHNNHSVTISHHIQEIDLWNHQNVWPLSQT